MSTLDIDAILELLPHKAPFVLIDRVLEILPGNKALGIKNLSYNEPFFAGHFPSHPVMPGVLIIEAMAQLSGILAAKTAQTSAGNLMYLVSVDEAKFRKAARPGDTLLLESRLIKQKSKLWKFEATAAIEGKLSASASISTMSA
jgi:3-hydroxyacyl-[acyl-carrier-protein] dehydratase